MLQTKRGPGARLKRWLARWRQSREVERLAHLDDRMLSDIGAPSWIRHQVSVCRAQRERREAALLDGGGVLPW